MSVVPDTQEVEPWSLSLGQHSKTLSCEIRNDGFGGAKVSCYVWSLNGRYAVRGSWSLWFTDSPLRRHRPIGEVQEVASWPGRSSGF